MSWEYRRWADGRVEIVRRRSFLKLSLWSAASLLAVVAMGTFTFLKPRTALEKPSSSYAQQQAMVEVLRRGDVKAVYEVLPAYSALDRVGKQRLLALIGHLQIIELRPFLEHQLDRESDSRVRQTLRAVLMTLERSVSNDSIPRPRRNECSCA